MNSETTAKLSSAAKANHESMKSRTCHAAARAEDMLSANGWMVLRRHASGGQEVFASTRTAKGHVFFARIRARTATLFGGDLDHAVDRHLGKSAPDDSALEFVEMVKRYESGGVP